VPEEKSNRTGSGYITFGLICIIVWAGASFGWPAAVLVVGLASLTTGILFALRPR
jgi:hypothetical protein